MPAPTKGFEGNKIKIKKILGREIAVYAFKLGDSKVFTEKGSCMCLCLQIAIDDEMRVVFTSASRLIEIIQKVQENGFPFTTTIIEENDRYIFT